MDMKHNKDVVNRGVKGAHCFESFGPWLQEVLREMCRSVGCGPLTISFHKDGWYRTKTWTREQEDSFKAWLTDYMYNNPSARRELMTITSKNKRFCRQFAEFFVFMYGWRVKA